LDARTRAAKKRTGDVSPRPLSMQGRAQHRAPRCSRGRTVRRRRPARGARLRPMWGLTPRPTHERPSALPRALAWDQHVDELADVGLEFLVAHARMADLRKLHEADVGRPGEARAVGGLRVIETRAAEVFADEIQAPLGDAL